MITNTKCEFCNDFFDVLKNNDTGKLYAKCNCTRRTCYPDVFVKVPTKNINNPLKYVML